MAKKHKKEVKSSKANFVWAFVVLIAIIAIAIFFTKFYPVSKYNDSGITPSGSPSGEESLGDNTEAIPNSQTGQGQNLGAGKDNEGTSSTPKQNLPNTGGNITNTGQNATSNSTRVGKTSEMSVIFYVGMNE